MANDVPSWTDDGALNFAPTRELAFVPQTVGAPAGPWSPPPAVEHKSIEKPHAAPKPWPLWPWRLAIGLAQGLGFLLLLRSRTAGLLPGADPFLFDAIALPLLLVPFLLLDGLGAIALRRFTDALKNGLVGAATITLPLACAAALFLISMALGNGPAPLIVLILLMTTLVVAISASHRAGAGSGPRKAWRDGTECFGAILLLILSGLALWALDVRVGALGWTTQRLFAGVAVFFLAAYGVGYSIAALIGLRHGRWMQQLATTNMTLGLALLLALSTLASPLADPMRLAAASQVARLANGDVAPAAFDFANLARDSARFGAQALAGLGHSPFPDIAKGVAQSQPVVGPSPNPTAIGANIAVRTPGAALPPALLAKDWRNESGAPPCLTTASQKCEAYFLDLDSDGTREILLVAGSETRWWGAVMRTDAANHWTLAGHLAAPACGPTLSDLRAGRFKVVPPAQGWQDLSVGGARLAVVATDSGCSHY